MAMTKLLHTADVHLQQVGDERWQALLAVLEQAEQLKVEALTIGGDLFDQNFNAHDIRDQLRAVFADRSFQTIILPGNHDARSFQQGFYFGQNVTVIDQPGQLIQLNKNTTITGLPFAELTTNQLIKQLEKINATLDPKKTNIFLFHGELTDLFFNSQDFGDEGQKRYLPLKLNLLKDTVFDYILAGHFHTNFVVKNLPNKRLKQGGFFVYPGSPVSITIKETSQRSAALIELGKAPQPIGLETHHYQQIESQLRPDDTTKFLIKLEKELQQLKPYVTGLISINGFFDQAKLGLTEEQIHQKITALAEKYHSQLTDDNFAVKDISTILDTGLYQAFTDQLNQQNPDPDIVQRLTNMFIKAMIKVNS
jgi:DNA repair protein SbcD/Mre11